MMTASERVFAAPVAQKGPVPAYQVVEMEGPFKRTICQFDEKSKQIVRENVISDVGYMVFFPRGHSHMYHSLRALEDAGFGEVVPLINNGAAEAEINKEHEQPTVHLPIERKSK